VIDAPLALAFTAGLVASVNPCGFPMLPAYLSFFVGADDGGAAAGGPAATAGRVLRALGAAAAVSAGFFAVFVAIGVPVHAGRTWLYDVAPWVTIAIGIALVGLGLAMLCGLRPALALPHLDRGGRTRGPVSMAVFGASYAVASLSCTLPVFLSFVAGTAGRTNLASGVATFGAFAAGMATVLTALTVALAFARTSLVRHLRRVLPYVDRISGLLLVLAGAYLIWYWTAHLAGGDGGAAVDLVESWSAGATARLADGGVRLGLVLAVVAAGAGAWAVARRRTRPGGRAGAADQRPGGPALGPGGRTVDRPATAGHPRAEAPARR
jgi:cytochrome c biogenesis protein CcdA